MNPLSERSLDAPVIGDDGELLRERELNDPEESLSLPYRYLDHIAPYKVDRSAQRLSNFDSLLIVSTLSASILGLLISVISLKTADFHSDRAIPPFFTIILLGIIFSTLCYAITAGRPDKQKRKKHL